MGFLLLIGSLLPFPLVLGDDFLVLLIRKRERSRKETEIAPSITEERASSPKPASRPASHI